MSRTDSPPRRIVVLRHAETDDNAAGIWQGHKDSELSERGRRQVVAAAADLAAYEPALLLSSDLKRAAATADAVAQLTGLEVRLDARLREVHVGQWQGLHQDEVRSRHPETVAALARGEDVRRGVTGETRADVVTRTSAALVDVVRELLPGETAVVVTHGVSGRVAVADMVGLDQALAESAFAALGNCRWAELVEVDGRGPASPQWRLAGWNVGPRLA